MGHGLLLESKWALGNKVGLNCADEKLIVTYLKNSQCSPSHPGRANMLPFNDKNQPERQQNYLTIE